MMKTMNEMIAIIQVWSNGKRDNCKYSLVNNIKREEK